MHNSLLAQCLVFQKFFQLSGLINLSNQIDCRYFEVWKNATSAAPRSNWYLLTDTFSANNVATRRLQATKAIYAKTMKCFPVKTANMILSGNK